MVRNLCKVKQETVRYGQRNLMPLDAAPETARSDARRRAIIDVASGVFVSRGYSAASMSEIAAKLGGSKGTL